MSAWETLGKPVIDWARRNLSAAEVCWLCIIAIACLTILVTTRYARASELQDVQDDVTDVRISLLQKDLIDTRVMQCTSAGGFKQWYANRLGDLQRRYATLNTRGVEFSIPDCKDL